ncbi:MAG: radical SAM protein [Clostridia bacterium]
MTCPWCANPEGMSLKGTEMTDNHGTTKMSFKPIDCDVLIAEVLSTRRILIDGGGVTFSGGEPTLQFEALLYILKRLKEESIHTAIETNATHPRLHEMLPYLDLLIADFKHSDSVIHKQYTGMTNEAVIENLMLASHKNLEMWIRTPLINGFNADTHFIEDFIDIYKQLNLHNVSFELLRYHEFAKTKWEQCAKEYRITNGYVSDEIVYAYEKAYSQAGLKVIHT